MQSETEWATIGRIVAPFGVRGELKVLLLTDIPNRFTILHVVYLGPNHRSYTIKAVRPHKSEMVVLKLAGIDDANAAETLRSFVVSIPASELATLPPDFYYQHDILGLTVYTMSGQEVGVIVDIMVTGGNDVYSIKALDGREILIPAIKQVIKQIDLPRKMMYIDPIQGLLSDQEAVNADTDTEEGE